jgi:hypothetical protein
LKRQSEEKGQYSFCSVGNLKSASPLALNDSIAVPRAQFDLPNAAGSLALDDELKVSMS